MNPILHGLSRSLVSARAYSALMVSAGVMLMPTNTSHAEGNTRKVALDPNKWISFRVSSVEPLTHNTKLVRFELPSADHEMGMDAASCLMARMDDNGKTVARPYTPVSSNQEKGFFELCVKGYQNGKVSKHICSLQPGDSLEMKGPYMKFEYRANLKKKIGMICGGSGITPILQMIREIVRNPDDKTEITVLFANVFEGDIIFRNQLDAMAHLYPNLKVIYCLDNPPKGWDGPSGYITKELLQQCMPEPDESHLIMVCGPPPMLSHISGNKAKDKSQGEVEGLLKELGYESSMVFKF